MAAAFSSHTLFLDPVVPPVTGTPSRTRTFLCPSLRHSWSTASGTLIPRLPAFPPRPFSASLKVAESEPEAIDEEEGIQLDKNGSKDTEGILTMKALIEVYKESILNGDEEVVSEVETAICSIGKQKIDLFNEVERLQSDITSGKAKFLRLNADFENFRKSTEKDHLKFKSDIQGELIESLLPMVDSFERTKQKIKPETEKEKKIETSYHGIYKQFVETLRASHVAVVETVGKKFDPSVHEAVARVESQQFREGTVVQEVRRGFVLGDRIVRPAIVKVSSGPGIKNSSSSGEEGPVATVAKSDEASVPASDNS